MALLEVRDLKTTFRTEDGTVAAVNGLSFAVEPGSTLGIVGESGSGKSVTSLSIMRLLAQNGTIERGQILFKGENLLDKSDAEMRKIRGRDIAMIFQDPMTSLNPVLTVGRADRRGDPPAPRPVEEGRAGQGARRCCAWSASRPPRTGSRTTRTSSRAACASA